MVNVGGGVSVHNLLSETVTEKEAWLPVSEVMQSMKSSDLF